MKNVIKLFKRLCKEENVFCHKGLMTAAINHMISYNTCVFFGLCNYKRRYTGREQMSFFKIQLQLASILIDNNTLRREDLNKLLEDTLTRYTIKKYDLPIEIPEEGITDLWKEVIKYSNKEEIKKKVTEYKNSLTNA